MSAEEQERFDALLADRDRLRAALAELYEMVENGTLVRDTTKDSNPGWTLPALLLLRALQSAAAALKETAP